MAVGEKSMTANELYGTISENTEIPKHVVKAVISELSVLAKEEIKEGYNFAVPGLCRIAFSYSKPVKKGEPRVNPITKEEFTAPKNKPGVLKVRIAMAADVKRSVPSLNSKVGKAITGR